MQRIYASSLGRKRYGLGGTLKSLASLFLFISSKEKFLEQLQFSVIFVHGIAFKLTVHQYQTLRTIFLVKLSSVSPYFQVNVWTFSFVQRNYWDLWSPTF